MNGPELFLQRYNILTDFYLDGYWQAVTPEQMRQRPDPRVNSIAWNLWHLTRVEDAGLNRFVADHPQVLDDGGWIKRMNLPWRHHGSGMTFAEVDDLDRRVDLPALRAYGRAVQTRTREIVSQLDPAGLDAAMTEDRLRVILVDEGLAHSRPDDLVANYSGWSKGRCLMHFGLTHPFQHVGEMGVIASLLGIEF